MNAHPPLSTLADAAVESSGTCHCYPEWHKFLVKGLIYIKMLIYCNLSLDLLCVMKIDRLRKKYFHKTEIIIDSCEFNSVISIY